MRASLYLVGFAVASLVGTGIVEVGCSSSSTPATTSPEASTTTDSGGDEDVDAAVACTAAPVNAATFDAGNAIWSCLQTACQPSLAACGTDCPCNDAVLEALLCQADGGSSTACFTPVYEVDTAGSNVIVCLQAKTSGCGLTLDGGDSGSTSDATTTDAGTTSDAASTDGAPEAAP
jgi:hypothetical protein